MAHGTPDWGVTAGRATVYQLTDLGELAVRLGSPISHDRRGDVLWWDDFECGFAKWAATAVGAGASAALSEARARNGANSALLTGASTGGGLVILDHLLPFAALSRFGLEASFSIGTTVGRFIWRLETQSGTTDNIFEVRWNNAANNLQYLNDIGIPTTFATGVDLGTASTLFHTGKLVVDPSNGQYVRFILNERTYPLTSIAGQSAASTAAPFILAEVQEGDDAGAQGAVYVDDVILTQNEP